MSRFQSGEFGTGANYLLVLLLPLLYRKRDGHHERNKVAKLRSLRILQRNGEIRKMRLSRQLQPALLRGNKRVPPP